MTATHERPYIPALRFAALTRLYDPIVRVTTREKRFRSELLQRAGLAAGEQVLDVACGTGSLLALATAATPDAGFTGIDRDPQILEQARTKCRTAKLVCADATEVPFPSSRFDHVFATLMIHHLDDANVERFLGEVRRVLRPGGHLHVADWRRGSNTVLRSSFMAVRLLDGLDHTRRHARSTVAEILKHNGMTQVEEWRVLATPLGSIGLATATV